MNRLLNEIQTDLAEMSSLLATGGLRNIDDLRDRLHYLHAYIEKRKQDFTVPEPPAETEEPVESDRELVEA